MLDNITYLLPYLVLTSHLVFVFLLLNLIFRNSWGKVITNWFGRYSLALALVVALAAVTGSLFYSEVVGFEPCLLCWWQRVFLYPLSIIFAVAWWKGNRFAFNYAIPLATLSAILSTYHSYVYMGGTSILPCTALGGACSKIYVLAFSYITIPMMSLTISLFILILAWANNVYEKNRYA